MAGGAGAMPFAGVAWQVAQYVEGFRRLGHDVFYLEDTCRWPYDPEAETVCDDASGAVAYVERLMDRCSMSGRWAYVDVAQGGRVHGVENPTLARVLREADVLVNVSGVMVLQEPHTQIPARIYLETDPVLPQIEIAQGRQFTIDLLAAHTHHFTYGENFGAPDCQVPIECFHYLPTRPPVVLDWWSPFPAADVRVPGEQLFTTVANWRQTEKDIVWKGRRLTWSKDVQFERIIDLPRRVPVPLELAVASSDDAAMERLRAAGWRVRPAGPLSKNPEAYRSYIQGSAAEFSVAKEQNIVLRSGWFSDRTACYLAAGKPAVVQDTGFGRALPTGEGLFAFNDVEEAAQSISLVAADYARQSTAAREIAKEHLRAERVLDDLLTRL